MLAAKTAAGGNIKSDRLEDKTVKRMFALALGCLVLALPAWAQDAIKVGLVAPFSGPFADYGKQFDAGIKAFQKLNGDTVAGLGTTAVQPYLASAEQLFQPAMAERRIVTLEPAVEPDAVLVHRDLRLLRHQRTRTSHMPANSANIDKATEPPI